MDIVGAREGGILERGSMETYILPHIKGTASGNLLYDAGSSSQVFCDNREGRDGEEGGREGTYVYLWLIHVDVWQKPTQYCNYPPIKNRIKFLKMKEKQKIC